MSRILALLLFPVLTMFFAGLSVSTVYASQHGTLNTVDKGSALFNEVCTGPFPNNEIPTVCQDKDQNQSGTDNSFTGPDGILAKATNIISFIVGVAALIVIIISGLQFVLATGDPSRIANARNALIYALIGIGVAIFAQVIVRFVVNKL